MSHIGSDRIYINKEQAEFAVRDFHQRTGVSDEAVKTADAHMDMIDKMAKKHDTLYDRMQSYTDQTVEKSSWLKEQRIPRKKTKEVEDEIDKAAEAIGVGHLSSSQRSKRGKKFKEKAMLQSKMVNLSYECQWHRQEALNDLMKHGKNSRLGVYDRTIENTRFEDRTKDTYLKDVDEDIDQKAVMLKDIAFYYENRERYETHDETRSDIPFRYDMIENLSDEKQREKAYLEILGEFEKLDLSKFDYKDNNEFIDNEDKSFLKRYSELRAFSHVPEILEDIKEPWSHPGFIQKKQIYEAKADTLKEILADYEMRMIMLQSPYFTLLAGKDVSSFSEQDIRERMTKTEDPLIRAYLGRVLQKREMKGFGRGKKADKIFKEKLKALKSGKTEKKEPSLEERAQNEAQVIYYNVESDNVCKYPPFLYDKALKRSEIENKSVAIMWIHRQFRASMSNDRLKPEYLYQIIDENLYKSFVEHQQEMENIGAQVRFLENMKKDSNGGKQDEIDELIEKLAGSEPFEKLQKQFFEEAEQLEKKLNDWKAQNADEKGKLEKKASEWNK